MARRTTRALLRTDSRVVGQKDYRYEYPLELDLRPSSDLHTKLVEAIYNRGVLSLQKMDERTEAWDRTDNTLQAYIDLSTEEKKLREEKPNSPVSIVVPYSYAALETIMTYMVMAFINQRPIFQYEGQASEDTIGNKLMELIVDRQVEHYKAALALYVWMRDGLAYGIGGCAPVWRKELKPVRRSRTQMVPTLAGNVPETTTSTEKEVLFEGTELVSIGPRHLLLDPNISPHQVQNSEYVGWIEETNIQRILSLEKSQPEIWFNSRYVQEAGAAQSQFSVATPEAAFRSDGVLFPITLVHMYVDLIPSEWGLPPADDNKEGCYPEKWLFTMANDWFIIRAVRVESQHGKFPIALNAPDFDGYSTYPLGRLEVSDGLQTTLNWLFNSHIANVRKVINNTLVVDPSLVDVNDFKTAKEGGIVKLKSAAWGKGVKDAVYQLAVSDVTQRHIGDAEVVINLIQRITAATDNMMGLNRRGGERVSATESRNVALAANSRVEKIARIISIQGMMDLGYFMATNTQDYMSQDLKMKVTGNWPEELRQEFAPKQNAIISPDMLQVQFDTIVRDGSLMVDTAGVADVWVQLFQSIVQQPHLAPQFDIFRIFMHIGRLLGAKNLNDFRLQANTMPDQKVLDGAKSGNLVTPEELAAATGGAK